MKSSSRMSRAFQAAKSVSRLTLVHDIREAESLVTSHDPETWEPLPAFPGGMQERDYGTSGQARAKVSAIAMNPDPVRLLAIGPGLSPSKGAPLVASVCGVENVVLNGQARAMGLVLAYRKGTAEGYRAKLLRRAEKLGHSPEMVRRMSAPVLVRVIADRGALGRGLSRWEGVQEPADAALDDVCDSIVASRPSPRDEASATLELSRQMTLRAIVQIGRLTARIPLKDAMDAKAKEILRILWEDGIVTESNRSEWIRGGALSRQARTRLELAYLLRAVESLERARTMTESIGEKMERLVPALARVEARRNGMSILRDVQTALDILYDFSLKREEAGKFDLTDYLEQVDFTRTISDRVRTLARCLDGMSRGQIGKVADEWCKAADFAPRQMGLFDTAADSGLDPFDIWTEALRQLHGA